MLENILCVKINVTYFRDTALLCAVGWGCVLVDKADIVGSNLSVSCMVGSSRSPLSCVALQTNSNMYGFIVRTTTNYIHIAQGYAQWQPSSV